MAYSEKWDLDSIFPGGIHSPQLAAHLKATEAKMADVAAALDDLTPATITTQTPQIVSILTRLQQVQAALLQARVFVVGLQSEDVNNRDVPPMIAHLQSLENQADTVEEKLQTGLVKVSDDDFLTLTQVPELMPIAFNLKELRQQGKELLDDEREALIKRLNLDGLNAWSSHYDALVSTIQVKTTDEAGNDTILSAGQADNQLLGNADPDYRAQLMTAWNDAWGQKTPLFADTLNHLAGSRLTDYHAHHSDDVLKRPLELNRMSQQTLNTIWQVVDDNKRLLINFLDRKAELMGKDHAGWQDVEAPLTIGNQPAKHFTYDEAAEFIIKHFGEFSPKMAALAQTAFSNRWIEAENRPGKQPGGYMESLPETGESRIFLTFTGSTNDVSTIAHELGHAFHSSVMTDLPFMRQGYAMNVAETASTFAEMIVADANVKAANTDEERINLLNAKMENPVAMFLNIHARYLFETRFYEARKQGLLTAEQLDKLMLDAQKEAFGDSLSTYSPHFWATKLHFYIDDVPFYNFPYVFGYLFSLGIYARSQTVANFEDDYIALLRDTANMTTEELAEKHLGVDLTQPDFWEAGVKLIEKDVNSFLDLTDGFVS